MMLAVINSNNNLVKIENINKRPRVMQLLDLFTVSLFESFVMLNLTYYNLVEESHCRHNSLGVYAREAR